MRFSLSKEMLEAMGGRDHLVSLGIGTREQYRWDSTDLDLRRLTNGQVAKLQELLQPHTSVRGVRGLLRDIDVWVQAGKEGADKTRCKTCKQFEALVYEFMQKQPGHWLYRRFGETWYACYVGKIWWTAKVVTRNGITPAYTHMTLYYQELGITHTIDESWTDSDVKGRTVPEILTSDNLYPQSKELRADYDAQMARYDEYHAAIGRQFLARGYGTDNLDGNPRSSDSWRYSSRTVTLDRDGEPSRVVIDIPYETDGQKEKDNESWDETFWRRKSLLDEDDEDAPDPKDIKPEDADPDGESPQDIVIPIWPKVPTFDLRRHIRLRIHVQDLEPYVYDATLADKLVLPKDHNELIRLLVSDTSEFRDIIKSKGGGAQILCAGPSGCGKTLTAEVYAEVMERPLYSVQCSQLGTDPDALEKELLRVFSRSQRWKAILLLDECDVYVHERGDDLIQNAIVGVFLRVLEYYGGVLFMTTNRSDKVDDAIISRCLARIDYDLPTPEDQARIWKVLAKAAGIRLPDGLVEKIGRTWPRLSGRDVKQLLKLSIKVMASRKQKMLDFDTVRFVKRFKPAPGDGRMEIADEEPAGDQS